MRVEDIRAGAIVIAFILLAAVILDLMMTISPAPWWVEAFAAFAIVGCGASAGAIWVTRKL